MYEIISSINIKNNLEFKYKKKKCLYEFILNNINNTKYILYIPENCYVYNKFDNTLLNNESILIDNQSKLFITPYKYKEYIIKLLENKDLSTSPIQSKIKNITISLNNILQSIEFNTNINKNNLSKSNINLIKSISGIEDLLIINDLNYINKYKESMYNFNNFIINKHILKNTIDVKQKSIALCVIGQVRTFIYDIVNSSFKKYVIDDLEKKNIKYFIFFYLENKMTYSWQGIEKKKYVTSISKSKIKNIIEGITKNYKITFYEYDKIRNTIPIIKQRDFIHTLQFYLLYLCYLQMIEYEKKNNILFTHVIKLRPDMQYFNIISNYFNTNSLYTRWDIIYIFPRYIAETIPNIFNMVISPRYNDIILYKYFNNEIKRKHIFHHTRYFKNSKIYNIDFHLTVVLYCNINNINVFNMEGKHKFGPVTLYRP